MVKKLNREGIQRMVRNTTTAGNVVNRGGGGVDLAGYATQAWVDEGYLSKEFFNRLFTIHGANNTTITPNDTDSTISSIESMFGFWTNLYITALGNGGDIGSAIYLSQLADVNVAGVQNGQALVYNSATGKWVPGTGGIDLTAMWTALATSDPTKQIDGSHISSALGVYAYISNGTIHIGSNSITPVTSLVGYATESWVNTQISDMATKTWVNTQISDMATQTWVNTQISDMATKTWVNSNFITVAFFDRLFRAYNGSTLVNANDTTTTIDNIKAMFGFWTEFYMSALGTGGASGGIALGQLSDVVLTSPTDGQALVYDAANSQWVNGTVSGGGTDMNTVWTNLAAATNEQINATHLSTALSGYLPLSGGTLTDSNNILSLSSSSSDAWIYFKTTISGTLANRASVGYYSNFAFIANEKTKARIGVNDSGTPQYWSSTSSSTAKTLWHSGNFTPSDYLPLTGGTLTGTNASVLNVNGTATGETGITIQRSGTVKGWFGYHDSGYMYIYNSTRGNYLKYNNTGTLTFEGYTVYHSGNFTPSNYLPLTGGTLSECLIIHATNNYNDFNEGIRIQDAQNKWSGITYGATGSTGCTPASGQVAWFGAKNNSGQFIIAPNGSSSTTGLCLNNAGDMKWRDNTVIHSGNIGSQSVNYAASAGSVAWTNVSGRPDPYSSTSQPGYKITHNGWSYIRFYSGSNFWDIGTNQSAGGVGSYYGGFGIRANGEDGDGIYIKRGKSDFGKLVICVPSSSSECSIGYRTATTMRWTVGYTGSGTNFGWYYGSNGGWKLTLDSSGNLSAVGGVTALSDARHKNVIKDVDISVEDISRMPAVVYQWNDGRDDKDLHVGSLAQNWQSILPQVVMKANDKEGTLSMSYGVAALMASIVTARKVVDHERRIQELERENRELRKQLKIA